MGDALGGGPGLKGPGSSWTPPAPQGTAGARRAGEPSLSGASTDLDAERDRGPEWGRGPGRGERGREAGGGVFRRRGREKRRGGGSRSGAPVPARRPPSWQGMPCAGSGGRPVPQAAPASPKRPLQSCGRRDGTSGEVPPLRPGGPRSAHLRGSRSGLPQRPLSVRAGASAPRMLVPPPFGKAAPWPAAAPPAAAAGLVLPAFQPPPPRCAAPPPRPPWPFQPDPYRTAGTASPPPHSPPSMQTGFRGPTLSILQEGRRPADAPELLSLPPPNTAGTAAPARPAPALARLSISAGTLPPHCSEPQLPVILGPQAPASHPHSFSKCPFLTAETFPSALQVSAACLIPSVTAHHRRGPHYRKDSPRQKADSLPTTAEPSPHFFPGVGRVGRITPSGFNSLCFSYPPLWK